MKTVCVLGLGYIGLPTASILATNGYRVLGVDVSPEVVETVNNGDVRIVEPGLKAVVRAAIASGNLRAALAPEAADIFVLAVPTPLTDDRTANMAYVTRAAESIVPHLQPGVLVILESTSPPGTCRDLLKPILEQSGLTVGGDIFLAHCPERVLPGKILKELIENDRIIGGYDPKSAEAAKALYASFVEGEIILTDVTTAEMVKILENTFRDVNIALANEAAIICEEWGVDYWQVSRLANRHPRVNLHAAGPGVGGHCIPIDPWFLVEKSPNETKLVQLARRRNDAMPQFVADKALDLAEGGGKIAVLGLAYKSNVDDLRESPAIRVVELLRTAGREVCVHDPHVTQAPFALVDLEACIAGADCIVLLTGHAEFAQLDPREAAKAVKTPVLLDTRNHLDHDAWAAAGFRVAVLGRG